MNYDFSQLNEFQIKAIEAIIRSEHAIVVVTEEYDDGTITTHEPMYSSAVIGYGMLKYAQLYIENELKNTVKG